MSDKHQTNGEIKLPGKSPEVGLALLGLAVSALVQWGSGEGPFGIWDTMIGMLIALICLSFEPHVAKGSKMEYLAFCSVFAFALLFVFGVVLDVYMTSIGNAWWEDSNGERKFLSKAYLIYGHPFAYRDMIVFGFVVIFTPVNYITFRLCRKLVDRFENSGSVTGKGVSQLWPMSKQPKQTGFPGISE